jgi:hypothetical protein
MPFQIDLQHLAIKAETLAECGLEPLYDPNDVVDRIVMAVLWDVTGRRGWSQDWDSFEDDVKIGIVGSLRDSVRQAMALVPSKPDPDPEPEPTAPRAPSFIVMETEKKWRSACRSFLAAAQAYPCESCGFRYDAHVKEHPSRKWYRCQHGLCTETATHGPADSDVPTSCAFHWKNDAPPMWSAPGSTEPQAEWEPESNPVYADEARYPRSEFHHKAICDACGAKDVTVRVVRTSTLAGVCMCVGGCETDTREG